ncbi:MAG TPA: phosphate acyltransferase [Vicinamibacterales bacterium]|nr:phosphate acyltransferase [Vicinamibacterales bacterium]
MIRREDSLDYHAADRPGKVEVRATKPCLTAREMRLAYLPGATFPCAEIARDPEEAFRYTARGNLVGLLTNGSAVPGLGDVGARAAKPMQEGIAVLFKRLADIDVFDLEVDTSDPERFVETARLLEPTFGAFVLKDLRAPEGLDIYDRLCAVARIPVFHENMHSTAVVAVAALINALELAEKNAEGVKTVICGAGTVGIGCARMLLQLGVSPENLVLYDVHGALTSDREDLTDHQRAFARTGVTRSLADGLRDADVFIGASAGGVLTPDMINTMARFPIVFALATPAPEITYEAARSTRRDVIAATALAHSQNALVDHLSFPFVLRGALDARAVRISDGMLMAAARALADLAREEVVEEVSRAYGHGRFSFGPEYLLPKPIDPRIFVRVSSAVAGQAVRERIALRQVEPAAYEETLTVRLGTGRETMRQLVVKARQERMRVVFPEGTSETILRASSVLSDEAIACPVLLGDEAEIRTAADRYAVDLAGVAIVDPLRSPRADAYADEYFRLRRRRGVMRITATERIRRPEYFGAMMLNAGDADIMLFGLHAHYPDSLRVILETIGTAPGVRRVSSGHLVLLPKDVCFIADCAVNIDPDAETLAEIALQTAGLARAAGVEPRIALLSFSNFGGVDHPLTRKVRCAAEIVRRRAPDLPVDGEMQLATALNSDIRDTYFPFCELKGNATVLVFPDLQSANLAMQLLERHGEAVLVGPLLTGTRLRAHLIHYGTSVDGLVNLVAAAVVQAAALH